MNLASFSHQLHNLYVAHPSETFVLSALACVGAICLWNAFWDIITS